MLLTILNVNAASSSISFFQYPFLESVLNHSSMCSGSQCAELFIPTLIFQPSHNCSV